MASKSYWSYGKVNHKDGAMIPEGRVLIDTAKSFVYNEGGLKPIAIAFEALADSGGFFVRPIFFHDKARPNVFQFGI